MKRVFVLVDARVGLKEKDLEFLKFLDRYIILFWKVLTFFRNKVKSQVIVTKNDLVLPDELAKRLYLMKEVIFLFLEIIFFRKLAN